MRLAWLVAAVLLVSGCASSPPGVPGSFYLEATITVIDDRDDVPYAETRTRIRWWSESVDRWRWELDQVGTEPSIFPDTVSLSDGESVWFYESASNRYQRTVPFDLPPEFTAMPFPSGVLFGPANHASLDDLAAEFLSRGEDVEVVVAGADEVLGASATLLDYRPTWRSSTGSSDAVPATPVELEESGGVGRMWVDEDRMFVLRHEIDGQENRQYVVVEVTLVDYEPTFEDGRFEFTPPPGSFEGSSNGTDASTS